MCTYITKEAKGIDYSQLAARTLDALGEGLGRGREGGEGLGRGREGGGGGGGG